MPSFLRRLPHAAPSLVLPSFFGLCILTILLLRRYDSGGEPVFLRSKLLESKRHAGISREPTPWSAKDCDVFIGVLSGGVEYKQRRDAVRATWLTWARALGMHVTFFVDVPPRPSEHRSLLLEMMAHRDIVFIDQSFSESRKDLQPTEPGNLWNRKAAWVLQYGLSRGNFSYLVRTDDDSFWCLHRLRFVLDYMPNDKFIMAHFFSNHTDVQFVASKDVALDFVAESHFGTQDYVWTSSNFSWSPGVRVCNEASMTMGKHPTRGNLESEGWLAPEELPLNDRATFCERYIANHQSYPSRMQATYDAVEKWSKRPYSEIISNMQPFRCLSNLMDGSETVS